MSPTSSTEHAVEAVDKTRTARSTLNDKLFSQLRDKSHRLDVPRRLSFGSVAWGRTSLCGESYSVKPALAIQAARKKWRNRKYRSIPNTRNACAGDAISIVPRMIYAAGMERSARSTRLNCSAKTGSNGNSTTVLLSRV